MLKGNRLERENGKRVLLSRRRKRFRSGGFIVPMHAPETKAAGHASTFLLIKRATEDGRLILENRIDRVRFRINL